MKIDVRVPHLSDSVLTGTLLAWRKRPGEPVSRDETLADLETDKVIMEIPAPASGVLIEIRVEEGVEVKADEVVAVIETTQQERVESEAAPLAPAVPDKEAEIPLPPATTVVQANSPAPELAPLPSAFTNVTGDRAERRSPMTRLRQRVAERLVEVQHRSAILTTFNEVNLHQVNTLRQQYKGEFEARHGVKLGYMSFFVRATCVALKAFPVLNARIDNDDIVYQDYADIGIAVSTPRGLVVPILRNAETMGLPDIERTIASFAARAQTGSLSLNELTGGTFSITNGGVFGSLLSTPILNPPQSAILGMHRIQERPVAENGQVVIRPMMYLALSYDHRLIDGKEAVQFLVAVRDELEAPERLLLQI
jgi:2-oxoglutarate dehydrogenase E2 component (dihydrolipoamide succinyltransferase)